MAYDRTSLVAEIGGFSGLLLGISFFDFAKLPQLGFKKIQELRKVLQAKLNKPISNPSNMYP